MSTASQRKDTNRVAGGFKATLHNPNATEETKSKASERLQEMGASEESGTGHRGVQRGIGDAGDDSTDPDYQYQEPADDDDDVDDEATYAERVNDGTSSAGGGGEFNRVMGGYKATLKNPRVSEEAKEHAADVLRENDQLPED